MIRIQLRQKGFLDSDCDLIIEQAKAKAKSEARLKGLWGLISGTALIILGIGGLWFRLFNSGGSGGGPIYVIVVGCGLFGKGLLTAVSGIDDEE